MKTNTRKLTETAIMIALGTVLSLIKIDMPMGGGMTICSMLPLVVISFRYGWKWGVLVAFTYSVGQMLLGLDNVAYANSFWMGAGIVMLDYIIAYTVIGLSGIFGKERWSVAVGIAVTFTLRFLCHYMTGVWIWGVWMPEEFMGMKMVSPWIYSALYNGWYMLFELVATEIVAMLIYHPLKAYFRGEQLPMSAKKEA